MMRNVSVKSICARRYKTQENAAEREEKPKENDLTSERRLQPGSISTKLQPATDNRIKP